MKIYENENEVMRYYDIRTNNKYTTKTSTFFRSKHMIFLRYLSSQNKYKS